MSTTDSTTSTAKDEAGQVAQTGKEQASAVAGTATDAAKDVAGTAADQAKAVASQAGQQARDLAGQARDEVRNQASDQTQRLAQGVRQVAGELHSMASNSDKQGAATDLVRQLSDKAHDFASYLEGTRPEQLLDDVRNFARRRTGLFVGGAGVLGFVASRLVKGVKSDQTQQSTTSEFEAYPSTPGTTGSGYPTGTATGTGYSTGAVVGTGTGYTEPDYVDETYTTGYVEEAGTGFPSSTAGLNAPEPGYPTIDPDLPGERRGGGL